MDFRSLPQAFIILSLSLFGCRTSFDFRTPPDNTNNAPAGIQATITYVQKPADILILRDKQMPDQSYGYSYLKQDAFSSKIAVAAGPLAARIKWLPFDTKLAVVEVPSYAADSAQDPDAKLGQILESDGPASMKADTPDLAKLLEKRLTPEILNNTYYTQSSRPLTTLNKALTIAEGQTGSFFRKEARLSLVFILSSPPTDEDISLEEISSKLDTKYGAGNWTVSAAFDEHTSCSPVNANAVIAPPYTDSDFKNNRYEKGLTIRKLVTKSRGLMLSTCATSLSFFLQTVTLMAGGPQYVPVDLKKKVMSDTLDVRFDGKSLQGWRYEVGSTMLQIPTVIPSGSKVFISYEEDQGQRPNIAESSGDIYEKPLPDDEREFYASVNNVLITYCNECHGSRGPQFAFVDNFNAVKSNKAKILERLNKPESDPLHMPKTGSSQLDAETLKILTVWLGDKS